MHQPEIPHGGGLNQALMRLSPEARRRVNRAVNRGEQAPSLTEALLAAGLARRSLRGAPFVALLAAVGLGMHLLLTNLVAGGRAWVLMLDVLVALAWIAVGVRYALLVPPWRRAERLNREIVERDATSG